jgi:hypothetical protein
MVEFMGQVVLYQPIIMALSSTLQQAFSGKNRRPPSPDLAMAARRLKR